MTLSKRLTSKTKHLTTCSGGCKALLNGSVPKQVFDNGWWITQGLNTNNQHKWQVRPDNPKNCGNQRNLESRSLRFCSKCRTVWEIVKHGGQKYEKRYQEIRGLGIKQEICGECRMKGIKDY